MRRLQAAAGFLPLLYPARLPSGTECATILLDCDAS